MSVLSLLSIKKPFILAALFAVVLLPLNPARALFYQDLSNQQGQVLGDSAYLPKVLYAKKTLSLTVTPVDYSQAAKKWDYRVVWNRQTGKTGSIYMNGKIFVADASAEGQNSTGYTLKPATRYRIIYYSKPNGKGSKIVNTNFLTLAIPKNQSQAVKIPDQTAPPGPSIYNPLSQNYQNMGQNFANLPSCENRGYLSYAPTDSDSYASIAPLGATSNSGHITPSDHMYVNLNLVSGQPPKSGQTLESKSAKVYAPGDAYIIRIEKQSHSYSWSNGRIISDYAITFSPCKDLFFYYYHLGTVSQKIMDQLTDQNAANNCATNAQGNISNSTCGYSVNLAVTAGEQIGTVGGVGLSSFDFGSYDLRTPELGFLDKQRMLTSGRQQFLHTTCPLNYYSDQSLKSALFLRIQNTKKNADGLPDCGQVMQDMAGTIQGNWFVGDPLTGQSSIQPIDKILSITHRNTDPSQGVISVGGTLSDMSVNYFTPANTGTHNTEPGLVTANGQIYCYDKNSGYDKGSDNGYYLFQLTDTNQLKAEFQTGSCPQNPQFSVPTIYQR